jgi:hypothetical protein
MRKVPGCAAICRFRLCHFLQVYAQSFPPMLAKIYSAAVCGVDAYEVEVEVNAGAGDPKMVMRARAYDRILKVSRTIADLDDRIDITPEHVSEAIQYRTFDRTLWI